MKQYFEIITRQNRTAKNGMPEMTTEMYLMDALSFTEAEANIIHVLSPYGDLTVKSIKRSKIVEVVTGDYWTNVIDANVKRVMGENKQADEDNIKWFECKVNFIYLDERNGKEKRMPSHLLVAASSVNAAHDTLISHMRGTTADYDIEKIAETKILEVYEKKENN